MGGEVLISFFHSLHSSAPLRASADAPCAGFQVAGVQFYPSSHHGYWNPSRVAVPLGPASDRHLNFLIWPRESMQPLGLWPLCWMQSWEQWEISVSFLALQRLQDTSIFSMDYHGKLPASRNFRQQSRHQFLCSFCSVADVATGTPTFVLNIFLPDIY